MKCEKITKLRLRLRAEVKLGYWYFSAKYMKCRIMLTSSAALNDAFIISKRIQGDCRLRYPSTHTRMKPKRPPS